jgi:hypothetical protein
MHTPPQRRQQLHGEGALRRGKAARNIAAHANPGGASSIQIKGSPRTGIAEAYSLFRNLPKHFAERSQNRQKPEQLPAKLRNLLSQTPSHPGKRGISRQRLHLNQRNVY